MARGSLGFGRFCVLQLGDEGGCGGYGCGGEMPGAKGGCGGEMPGAKGGRGGEMPGAKGGRGSEPGMKGGHLFPNTTGGTGGGFLFGNKGAGFGGKGW